MRRRAGVRRRSRAALATGLAFALAGLAVLAVGCGRGGSGDTGDHAASGHAGAGDMEAGQVMVDARRQQLVGVTYATVARRDVEHVVRTVGTVAYDESRLTDVNVKFHGWVEDLKVDRTGTLVQGGQVLFTLYSPELVSTQEEYVTAYESLRQLQASGDERASRDAAALLEAARRRLGYWDIEAVHLRDLERDRIILRALPIHSPATGYVIEKNIVAGSHVQAGQHLYRLVNLDQVWVLADVYEYELPFVQLGQQAEVTLAYLPGETLAGAVTYVYPYLQSKERTVKVRIQLANPGHRLKSEMYANVVLRARKESVLVVPQSAVLDSGKRRVAFVSLGDGRFEPREVQLGALFESEYEVLEGLQEGETVVASGNFLLDSESQLSAGMRQMQH